MHIDYINDNYYARFYGVCMKVKGIPSWCVLVEHILGQGHCAI